MGPTPGPNNLPPRALLAAWGRATPRVLLALAAAKAAVGPNCGTGAGGFAAGNRCQRKGSADLGDKGGVRHKSVLGAADELEQRMTGMTPARAARAVALRAKVGTAGNVAATGGAAKYVGKTVGKAEQAYADLMERKVAAAVGGRHVAGEAESTGAKKQSHGDPLDVAVRGGHAIEVKTLLKGGKQSLSVHDDALVRKVDYAARTGETYHTVAVDHRDRYGKGKFAADHSGNEVYYKRGSGRYSLSQMHPVKSRAELHRLIRTPDADLPPAARGSLPSDPAALAKLRASGDKDHAARLRRGAARRALIRERREKASGA